MILNALLFLLLSSCDIPSGDHYIPPPKIKVVPASDIDVKKPKEILKFNYDTLASAVINTKRTKAEELVDFAETLEGIPYKYGSTDPRTGFDCSGFITYVFNHFGI